MKHSIANGRIPKDGTPFEGPAFSRQQAADYLDVSLRQVDLFEEAGELEFFNLGQRMKRVTKGQLDALLRRAFEKRIGELEGREHP